MSAAPDVEDLESPWERPGIKPRFASLAGEHQVDVAIVGAGLTGLAAALTTLQGGASTLVADAQDIGCNASGRNAAHVMPMFWGMKKSPAQVLARFGAVRGSRMNAAVAGAGRELFALIARYGIACEANPRGLLCVARSATSFEKLVHSLAAWLPFGGQFAVVGPDSIRAHVDSGFYHGGVRLVDGGTLNPLLLVRGMAASAANLGGRIFAGSAVRSFSHDGGTWRLEFAAGTVQSRVLLVATGGSARGPFSHLPRAGYAVDCRLVATAPLPDRGLGIIPCGLPVADLDDSAPFGPLIDATGALVLSVLPGRNQSVLAAAEQVLRPRLRRAFPQLEAVPFVRHTGGRFVITHDGVPRVMRLGRSAYAAVGCNGSGYTMALPSGRDLGLLALGAAPDDLSFPVQDWKAAPLSGLLSSLLRQVVIPLANRQRGF